MIDFSYANFAVDIFVILIMLLLFVGCVDSRRDSASKIMKIYITLTVLQAAFDILLTANELFPVPKILSILMLFCYDTFGYSIAFLFGLYYTTVIMEQDHVKNPTLLTMAILWFLFVIEQGFGLFTESFGTFVNGSFERNNTFFWISYVYPAAIFIFVFIRAFCEKIPFRTKIYVSLCCLIPGSVLLLENVMFRISLSQISTALGVLGMYIMLYQKRNMDLLETERELSERRINSMMNQIQPHFLFNTLSTIRSLAKDNPETRNAITDFSDYLRENLQSIDCKDPIAFAGELSHVETYIRIEKLRFGERLIFTEEIGTDQIRLPALSLQPFVENAVKHGFRDEKSVLHVHLKTEKTEHGCVITVSDDGIGFDSAVLENPNSIGIRNTMERLKLMVGAETEIRSQPGVGTNVTVFLPNETVSALSAPRKTGIKRKEPQHEDSRVG